MGTATDRTGKFAEVVRCLDRALARSVARAGGGELNVRILQHGVGHLPLQSDHLVIRGVLGGFGPTKDEALIDSGQETLRHDDKHVHRRNCERDAAEQCQPPVPQNAEKRAVVHIVHPGKKLL